MMMWLITAPGFVLTAALFSQIIYGGELRSILVLGIALIAVLFVAVLYRPTRWYAAAIALILPAILAFSLRPVCQPLSAETVAAMNPPIAVRLDQDIYMDVFQPQPDGSWAECHTQLSRWMFF